MTEDVDLVEQTQLESKPEEQSQPACGGRITTDEVKEETDEGNIMSRLEAIETSVKDMLTKTDLAELEARLESGLVNRQKIEAEREETARALVSLYDSFVLKYTWLNKAHAESGVEKNEVGTSYKKLLRDSASALVAEILDLLGRYGIRAFCETGMFNGKRHLAVASKWTKRRELQGKIAEVKRNGFLQSRGEQQVVFRPLVVVVYRCSDM